MPTDFTLDDFMAQMNQVRRLGPMGRIMAMLPGMADMMKQVKMTEGDLERSLTRMRAMYQSMTPDERKRPEAINSGRRRRIARGAGVDVVEVSKFITDFQQSRAMMRAVVRMGRTGNARPARALGLVTENPLRRDPTFVHWTPPDWHRIGWLLAGVVAAALAVLAWGRYGLGIAW